MGDTYGPFRSSTGYTEQVNGLGQRIGGEPISSLPNRAAHRPVGPAPTGTGPVGTRRRRPMIVGIGGTTRTDSATHRALTAVLATMAQAGAETVLFGSAELDLPMYAPERPERSAATLRLLAAVEQADAVVIATPGYHGGMSGLVKNPLDYLEDLRGAPRPYLDGRAVGLHRLCSGHPGRRHDAGRAALVRARPARLADPVGPDVEHRGAPLRRPRPADRPGRRGETRDTRRPDHGLHLRLVPGDLNRPPRPPGTAG